MYCTNCGNQNPANSEACFKCGFRFAPAQNYGYNAPPPPAYNNGVDPVVALIVSFFITGVGQMLNKQVVKGIVLLASQVLMAIFGAILLIFGIGILFLLISFVIWLVSVIDAYKIAQKIRAGRRVGEWEFF
jgi:TM2 domain-containing membrane protein YozV